jgi:TRAP-type mannitol/chloroaromatic compound transport system permease small subunit
VFKGRKTNLRHDLLGGFRMLDAIVGFFTGILYAFYNMFYAVLNAGLWLDWLSWENTAEDKQSLMRFIYYGGSGEFFFVVIALTLLLIICGMFWHAFGWRTVRILEGFANVVGRFFAWAGLIMVLQQIVVIFIQRIFLRAEISMGFGMTFAKDISWWAEELKLFNALVVALCCTYTFVQGGHVRVDLVYAAVGYRAKKCIDMFGSIFFMMPVAILIWLYSWFFLWRHLIVPNPSASDTLDRLLNKSRALRWNVETIGFSPNGFNAYFLFKILIVAFCAMVFLQAIAFFMRSYLELKEGPLSEGDYLDKDVLGDADAELVADIH